MGEAACPALLGDGDGDTLKPYPGIRAPGIRLNEHDSPPRHSDCDVYGTERCDESRVINIADDVVGVTGATLPFTLEPLPNSWCLAMDLSLASSLGFTRVSIGAGLRKPAANGQRSS